MPQPAVTPKDTTPMLYFLDLGVGGDGPISPDMMKAGQIMQGSPDGRPLKPLVSHLPMPDGIDIHVPSGRMFWTCMGVPSANDGCVMSAWLDGTDAQTVIGAGALHTGKQLVVDEAEGKLYFSDREGLRVMRSSLDGTALETLVQTGDWTDAAQMADQTRWPVGIAVDDVARKFYWTQKGPSKGGQGRIFRASMDMPSGEGPSGRSDVELLFSDLPEPIDLEFEADSGVLYWTDRGEYPTGNTLNRAYVGTDVQKKQEAKQEIISRHFHEAIGVKIDRVNKHIYVADIGGAVYRMDMDGSNKKRIYDTELSFTGIAVMHV